MPSSQQILQLLAHPTELRSVINWYIWHDSRDITKPEEFETTHYDRPTMRKCWDFLDMTSRSFATVVKQLEGDLARTICLFYLALRALDTVEDDMTLDNSIKLPLLRSLHEKLYEPGWTFNQSGPNEKDRQVLVEFDAIQAEFAQLETRYQEVIADITRKMGAGMADFAALATPQQPVAEVNSISDYDLYCHYVAGLVGEGLSGLFATSGKERSFLSEQLTLSNSMGLLLQKTNILRDIKEDVDEGRGFWPREIWSKHGFNSMKELVDPAREKEALFAASEMTLDALRHATDALDYLTLLKCQSVFNFVAIPAVMALATLERCFMNPNILKRNVKIRRGEAVGLMNKAVNPRDVSLIFREYVTKIHAKVSREDPNMLKLSVVCAKVVQWSEHHYPSFLTITMTDGKPQTAIDSMSIDARTDIFKRLANAAQVKAANERREAMMADLRARGILPTLTPEQQVEHDRKQAEARAIADAEPFPYLMVIGAIVGMLALIIGLGGGISYGIYKYYG